LLTLLKDEAIHWMNSNDSELTNETRIQLDVQKMTTSFQVDLLWWPNWMSERFRYCLGPRSWCTD